MAASSSRSPDEQLQRGRRVSDGVFEMYKPTAGYVNLEIIFFHGFPKDENDEEDAYFRTWMKADGSACWLNNLLADAFPQARILCMYYGEGVFSSAFSGDLDSYLLGEYLAQSIVEFAGVGQNCPVILVGHCVGGLVLKEVCLQCQRATLSASDQHRYRYSSFLDNLKTTVFFGTPHIGSQTKPRSNQGGPLLQYFQPGNLKATRINSEFSALRHRYGWETAGICETNETLPMKHFASLAPVKQFLGLVSLSSPVVGEPSARNDMDRFIALPGRDHYDICKPSDQTSDNFVFLQNILSAVREKEVKKHLFFERLLNLPKVFINTTSRVSAVISTLRLKDPEPLRVVLVGMGGIGKTTLAKQVVLEIGCQFEFICFIENTQQNLASRGFQRLVVSNLYKGNGTKVSLRREEEVWMLLSGRKVLMVIDDLDILNEKENKISMLWDTSFWATGSRLIVTSHNHRLITGTVIHEVCVFSNEESRDLFEAHLTGGVPETIPENLVSLLVDKCMGLPLALEVIGSYLNQMRDLANWRDALCRLEMAASLDGGNAKNDRLWGILRVAYENLGELEQAMFLDLTVFDLYGSKAKHYGVDLLKVALNHPRRNGMSSDVTLRNLETWSFIRLTWPQAMRQEDGERMIQEISIHQQLRDMGRSINRPVDKLPELCRGLRDISDAKIILEKNKEADIRFASTQILSLHVDLRMELRSSSSSNHDNSVQFHWESLAKLEHLRLLRICNVSMRELGDTARFPGSLVMLHMIDCSKEQGYRWWLGDKCWPIREKDVSGLRNLSVLLLEKCGSVCLPRNFHELSSLRIFRIRLTDKFLKRLPESIGLLPNLEDLSIQSTGLEALPGSLLQSRSLQKLTIANCASLQSWPSLDGFPLKSISSTSGCYLLVDLKLINLPSLRELPEAFGQLKSLRSFLMSECSSLETLPESFGELLQLEQLSIEHCDGLRTLPESFGQLSQLTRLTMSSCHKLELLPTTFGRLKSLSYLNVWSCDALRVPGSFGDLQTLSYLSIKSCKPSLFQSIGRVGESAKSGRPCDDELSSIVPSVRGGGYTRGRPDCPVGLAGLLGHMGGLNTLGAHNSASESSRRLFENLTCLIIEDIPGLNDDIEVIGLFRNLKTLNIVSCKDLERLPESIGQLTTLETISLTNCQKLEGLPGSLGSLANLKHLTVWASEVLESLPLSLGNLSLQTLQIRSCPKFIGLPEDLHGFKGLNSLAIMYCRDFRGLSQQFNTRNIGQVYIL